MQKSVVQVWVNDSSSKQISVTPSSTCEDIIKYLAEQYGVPKKFLPLLELHVVHSGKDHSTVQREEKMMSHLQSLAEAGLRIDDTNHKNKYVLIVNRDAVKKAQKLTQGKSSWFSIIKKRSGIGHQRSNSLPSGGISDDSKHARVGASGAGLSSSSNALLKSRPSPDPDPPSPIPSTILEAEKMPSSTPASAPHLTPRLSISPPKANMRARSKTLAPSLSTSDLRNQEALNQMITQRIRNRSSLSYERPPLDPHFQGDVNEGQNSPRAVAPAAAGSSYRSGSPRAVSPPPPQRLFEPPPSIVHLSPSTSSSSISIASASLPASSAPRQRALTTSGVLSSSGSNRLTPPRSQFAEMTIGSAGTPATSWKHDSFDSHLPLNSSSSSSSSISSPVSSSSASSSSSSLASSSGSSPRIDDEHLELLAVVELLKKASS